MRVNASRAKYAQGLPLAQFYDRLPAAGTRAAWRERSAVVSDLFLTDTPKLRHLHLDDRAPFPPSEQIEATTTAVSPGFFEMMQVRLVRGRFIDARDKDGLHNP